MNPYLSVVCGLPEVRPTLFATRVSVCINSTNNAASKYEGVIETDIFKMRKNLQRMFTVLPGNIPAAGHVVRCLFTDTLLRKIGAQTIITPAAAANSSGFFASLALWSAHAMREWPLGKGLEDPFALVSALMDPDSVARQGFSRQVLYIESQGVVALSNPASDGSAARTSQFLFNRPHSWGRRHA